MSDRSRWDPEMRAYQAEAEAIAAKFPPVKLEIPLEPHRAVNDAISLARGARGPEMAETTERWVAARGRRIYCRVHRPRTDRPLPVVVYFHGGGWVWGSVDTHNSAARSLAAAGDVAVVSVDYALSPEAKFPQALEECAAVVRHVARDGADWGLDPTRILLGGDSAGGNLALATALLLRDSGGPKLAGIVTAYPVCDSRFDTPSYQEFATGHVLTREKMAFYWSVYVPHEADRAHPLAAPLTRRPDRPAAGADPAGRTRCAALGRRGARGEAAGSRGAGGARNLSGRTARFPARHRRRAEGARRGGEGGSMATPRRALALD